MAIPWSEFNELMARGEVLIAEMREERAMVDATDNDDELRLECLRLAVGFHHASFDSGLVVNSARQFAAFVSAQVEVSGPTETYGNLGQDKMADVLEEVLAVWRVEARDERLKQLLDEKEPKDLAAACTVAVERGYGERTANGLGRTLPKDVADQIRHWCNMRGLPRGAMGPAPAGLTAEEREFVADARRGSQTASSVTWHRTQRLCGIIARLTGEAP